MNKTPAPFRPEDVDFDTKLLTFILAIVDEQSLSRAAEKLYLSQPALSRYLKSMEQTLGTPIFTREHNELRLTNAGKIFVNGARSMLHIEEELQHSIRNARQEQKTVLVAAVQDLCADFMEAHVHPVLRKQNPQINLEIRVTTEAKVRELTREGFVDLGIFLGALDENPFFLQESLFESELAFYASPQAKGLAQAKQEGFRLSCFSEDSMMLSPAGSILAELQQRILLENGLSEPDICVRGQVSVLTDLISLGYGNVILPKEVLPELPDQIFSFLPPEHYHCIAAWYRGRPLSAPARDYIMLAEESLRKEQVIWSSHMKHA